MLTALDISRFGKDSFLVHTKSDAQAVMLLNMKLDTKSLVKGVKPHFTFSYAKGVLFNEDIYELSENEILAMCPDNVWKIFKVPKSNMIVLTFMDSVVPHEIIIENEIIKVRPYRQRPLQCFNCFGFGHVSDVCTRAKICQFCSQPEHGACTRPRVCANCRASHDSRNKSCNIFKKEQEALLLSAAEHISIGHAKKLLSQRSYSAAVRDFHPKPISACNKGTLSTTGLERLQTVQSKTSRASCGGAPRASSGGDPGATPGGGPGASSGGASRASSDGAPLASSGGAPRASSGGAPWASSGWAPRASYGGAPRAFSCGALPVSSGGASRTSAGGTSGVPPDGTSSSSLETPQTSEVPQGSSHNSGIRFEPQSPDCSLARSGSPSNLNYFSLSGSLPDLQNLPDSNENVEIVVHKTMDAEEVESIAVGQKRARSPSSLHSNSHGLGRNAKSKLEGQMKAHPIRNQLLNLNLKVVINLKVVLKLYLAKSLSPGLRFLNWILRSTPQSLNNGSIAVEYLWVCFK